MNAAPAKPPFATFGSRVAARLIDGAMLAVLYLVVVHVPYFVATLFFRPPSALLLALFFLPIPLSIAYFAVLTARSGQTVGKRLMGIQVLDTSGVVPSAGLSTWRAVADFAFSYLSRWLIGLVDYLWMLRQRESRTLHDLTARTTVRRLADPPDRQGTFTLVVAALLVTVAFTVMPVMVRQSKVQSLDNMSPTIRKGERWQVSNLAYHRHSVQLDEVVAFRSKTPPNRGLQAARVVGLPNDLLALRSGQIQRLAPLASGKLKPDEISVPPGSIAILAQDRPELSAIQLVPFENVRGKVVGITSPLWRVRVVK